jgi:hypothetical protein
LGYAVGLMSGRAGNTGLVKRKGVVTRKNLLTAAAVTAIVFALAPIARMQTTSEKLRLSAFAVNMSNIGSGQTAVVDIRIDRWSTAEERQELISTFLDKGADALLRALQKAPVKGRFSIPGLMGPDPHQLRLGHNIGYAWQAPLPDGGRKIVLATDRYIGFQEARNQPRSIDYPFTLFEIHLDKGGKGEGKVAVATKISFDKKKQVIELENYSSEPVRLTTVKVEK